jgi:hypothetical protein
MRYEGAGVLIEEGTTNLVTAPNDLTVKAAASPELTIYPNYFVCADTDRAYQKCAITADGGALSCWVEAYGTATQIRVGLYDATAGAYLVNTTFALTGVVQRLEVNVPTTTAGNTVQLILRIYPGTTYVDWTQLERKTYGTSRANGTRSPESLSVPVPFTPQTGGSLSFRVDVTDKCKRQVLGVSPTLLTITRADGGNGLEITHAQAAAEFRIVTYNDAGEMTYKWFSDSLIPNGTRELEIIHDKAIPAIILHCDGNEIARIDNPELPSGWGRAYLLSDAAGKNHAHASVGNLRMVVA